MTTVEKFAFTPANTRTPEQIASVASTTTRSKATTVPVTTSENDSITQTSMINSLAAILTTTPAYSSATVTATITTTIIQVTHTTKGEVAATDWISQGM